MWLLAIAIGVIAGLDLSTSSAIVVLSFMWVPVVASVALASPRATAWLAVWAAALLLIVGGVQNYLVDPNYWIRFAAMAGTAVVVIYLAVQVADREERLHTLATTDALTGLANRRGLDMALDLALKRRGRDFMAVLYVDLDGFKSVNS